MPCSVLDISAVVVTWNAKRFVRECLTSIEQQRKYLSVETIVIDNGSSDGTPELIREQFPQVRLIQNRTNLGFAKANNLGIARSTGKYVCLVNSDAIALDGCFQKMLSYMEQNPTTGMLGPRMLGPDGKTRRSCMRFPSLWNSFCRALALDSLFGDSRIFGGFLMRDFQHNRVKDVDVLNGWFWMVRRKAINNVGGLDERFFIYGEDIDWCKRFHQAGWGVVFYPEAEAVHHGGASSSNAPVRFYIEMQRANLQYWKKHHGRPSLFCYLLTVWLTHAVRTAGYAILYLVKGSARSRASFKMKRGFACIRWLMGLEALKEAGAE